MEQAMLFAVAAGGLIVVLVTWWWLARRGVERARTEAESRAKEIVRQAERDAESRLREADVAAKEKLLQARTEFEKVSRTRRGELEAHESRIAQREDKLDRREEDARSKEKDVEARERALAKKERRLETRHEELEQLYEDQRTRLEQISGLTAHQAAGELRQSMENDARMEAAHLVKRIEDEAREKADREAQRIIGTAIQRSASDYIAETTISVVHLPSDDMKGRVIGREGRNIRALELATGVDLIVDDTPEAVILSGFDPYRREIARVALERLVKDGRIHPARIEEVVEKVKDE
ncbi:MAG: Rnase Y domain-containing protein, partial [Acidobacteriota bacterium]|nr:Rnase Y domain-containing protein [Acidobacteriota bacterium]